MNPDEGRERLTANDAARALSRLLPTLAEQGCTDGSPRCWRMTRSERETREVMRELRDRLRSYFGEDNLD